MSHRKLSDFACTTGIHTHTHSHTHDGASNSNRLHKIAVKMVCACCAQLARAHRYVHTATLYLNIFSNALSEYALVFVSSYSIHNGNLYTLLRCYTYVSYFVAFHHFAMVKLPLSPKNDHSLGNAR